MTKNITVIIFAIAVVAALVLSVFNFLRPATVLVQTPEGLKEIQVGAQPGPDYTQTQNFMSSFMSGGKIATSTSGTTVPLKLGDLKETSVIDVTLNVQDAALTFPASTTLSAILPKVGDMRTWYIRNATTTAAMDITITASTGVLLKNSTSTAILTGDTDGGNFAVITLIKKANTDYNALYDLYVD